MRKLSLFTSCLAVGIVRLLQQNTPGATQGMQAQRRSHAGIAPSGLLQQGQHGFGAPHVAGAFVPGDESSPGRQHLVD